MVLLGEDAGWDQSDTWFHALEEEPVDVSASQRGTALGESDMPSYYEITHNMVQHHESPGEEAAPVLPSNPRMAPVPRNPYGQMVRRTLNFIKAHALQLTRDRTSCIRKSDAENAEAEN